MTAVKVLFAKNITKKNTNFISPSGKKCNAPFTENIKNLKKDVLKLINARKKVI